MSLETILGIIMEQGVENLLEVEVHELLSAIAEKKLNQKLNVIYEKGMETLPDRKDYDTVNVLWGLEQVMEQKLETLNTGSISSFLFAMWMKKVYLNAELNAIYDAGVRALDEKGDYNQATLFRGLKQGIRNLEVEEIGELLSAITNSSDISWCKEIKAIYNEGVDALVANEDYENALELDLRERKDYIKEFAERYPADAYKFSFKGELNPANESELRRLAEEALGKEENDPALLEIYKFVAARGDAESFVEQYGDRILSSDLRGEFFQVMHDEEENCLKSYLARDMLDDSSYLTISRERDMVTLAEIYALANEAVDDDTVDAIRDAVNNAFDYALKDAVAQFEEERPEQFKIIQKIYGLASKVERCFGVSIPQKENITIQRPDGSYGTISLNTEEDYHHGTRTYAETGS